MALTPPSGIVPGDILGTPAGISVLEDTTEAQLGPDPASGGQAGQAWRSLLALVGRPTSDGRIFDDLTWRAMPLSLLWQPENEPGHDGAVVVGRIDSIVRDGAEVWGYGILDTVGEAGRETIRLIREQFLRGISVDAAVLDISEGDDGLIHFTAEIGAATVVAFPAFAEAEIELMDELPDGMAASGEPTEPGCVVDLGEGVSLIASAGPQGPPRAWFDRPDLDRRVGLHVEADGRIWGHIYGWGECHTGSPAGRCIQVPRGGTYRYITSVDGRGVLCADGTQVSTGPVCIAADHANLRLGWLDAKDHYANTSLAVADVTCGEDAHGIWVAGAVRPGTPPELVHALRASGPSGDWRPIGGTLELVAILVVNTQGFPALAASYSDGHLTALVASGSFSECGCGGHGALTASDQKILDVVIAREREAMAAAWEADLGLDPASRLAVLDATPL